MQERRNSLEWSSLRMTGAGACGACAVIRPVIWPVFLATCQLTACQNFAELAPADAGDAAGSDLRPGTRFPSSLDRVNGPYTGPLFELSQDYPTSLPQEPRPWEAVDYRRDPDGYLLAVRRYCYEGNLPDWRVQENGLRRWYHMPWMHVGKHPREATHGLTWELPSPAGKLAPQQTEPAQSWAVGLFNPVAGYTIGRVWKDTATPPQLKESRFSVGAVSVKLLFTSATADQLPFLAGAPEWTANIHQTPNEAAPKVLRSVRLLQMDVAVRDARAEATTGWVFGTFVYNKDAAGATPWDKMVPVGLMFGNDPDVAMGGTLRETKVARTAPRYVKLGYGGRMNGPVDNPDSACLSCHAVAEWRNLSALYPTGSWTRRRFWFRNIKAGDAFCAGEQGLDYSLQMAVAVRTFYSPEYNPGVTPVPGAPCMGLPDEPGTSTLVDLEPAPPFPLDRGTP